MKKGIKRISATFAVITLLMSMISVTTYAAGYIDTEQTGSLELHYQHDGQSFENCGVKLYRAAEVSADGEYTMTDLFSEYPVKVNDVFTSTEWKETASTLTAYVAADFIQPDQTAKTGANGEILFSSLRTGLYLVVSECVVTDKCTYVFDPFLISVPNLDENDNWIYNVSANPKTKAQYPTPSEIEHKVIKLWEDTGYENERPESITVEILKNGEKVSEQALSAENNWSYFWTAPDDGSIWQCVERDVPQNYTVIIREDSTTITVVNTSAKKPPIQPLPNAPQTGDNTNLSLYFTLMIISGILLIVIGKTRRRNDAE